MKKLICFVLLTSLAAAFLTGCNSNTKDNNTGDTNAEGATVVVEDVRGKVEIPKDPQRIVDISGNSDILHILGYEVVGTANSDAYDYTKFPSYLEDALKNAQILGYFYQDTMDIEAVLALNPDLVIMSTVQEKMYDQLSKVVPTVMIELAQIDWTDDFMSIAATMNKTEEARKWIDGYRQKAKEVGAKIREKQGEDTSYVIYLASGGTIFVFTEAGIGNVFYEDLGLARPNGLPVQENVSLPVISYEGMAEIDADYTFVVGTEDDIEALEKNSVWKNLESVKQGNYKTLPANVYFGIGYSPLGKQLLLEEVEDLIDSVN